MGEKNKKVNEENDELKNLDKVEKVDEKWELDKNYETEEPKINEDIHKIDKIDNEEICEGNFNEDDINYSTDKLQDNEKLKDEDKINKEKDEDNKHILERINEETKEVREEEINNCNDYEEESSNLKGKKIIKKIIIAMVFTIIVSFPIGFKLYDYNINKQKETESKNVVNVNIKGQKVQVKVNEIYDEVHKMANSLIIAEDNEIWGEENITLKKVEDVLLKVKDTDEYLYEELSKWKNLDFDNGVEVHNYVWKKLGGTVGKAIDLNKKGINKTIQKFK